MLLISLALFISFIISFVSLPIVIKIAKEKKLFDRPDDRKVHLQPIPNLGGIAIFAGVSISSLLLWPIESRSGDILNIMAAFIVIFFLGLKDDIIGISPRKKFIGEIIAAAIIIIKQDLVITSFHSLFGLHQISGIFSLTLTFLTVVLIINAYNLIDGIDGLSACLGALSVTAFGLFFYYTGQREYAILAGAMLGSLIAFLIFNYHPAKIFMGDTGSLLLGLINAIFALKFMHTVAENPNNGFASLVSCPVAAIAIIFVPLFDAVRVFTIRILAGRSPFYPEKNHIHHILLRCGLSHSVSTLLLIAFNIVAIGMVWYLQKANSTLTFFFLISLGVCFFLIADQKKIKPLTGKSESDATSKL